MTHIEHLAKALEALDLMRDEQQELDGEDCQECGGKIVTDRTPSYVFKQMDLCECGDPCERKEHDFAYFCITCSGECAEWGCRHCEMNFDALRECRVCGVPETKAEGK